jgi:exosortase E/protease (VPEID-CTERM system)
VDRVAWRWVWPASALVAEYLVLSFLVDFPLDGPALPIVSALRLFVPVSIGAAAAGWLLSRGASAAWALPPLPRHRLLLAAAHLAAFVGTALLALRLMGEGAPPLTPAGAILFLAAAGTTALLAVATAVPVGWLARTAFERWRMPLLAIAIGVGTWRAASAAEGLWSVLSDGTLSASAALLRLVTSDVHTDDAQDLLGVGDFEVLVAPVCSGVDGIGLVVLFLAVWISLARERVRFPRVLVLLPLGALAAWVANVFRISILVLVGAAGHERIALGGLHSKLGWILFTAIALGGVALSERTSWFRRPEGTAGEDRTGAPVAAAPFLAPMLAALGTALVTSIWATGPVDGWYGARIAAAVGVLLLARRSLPAPSFGWSWVAALLGVTVGAAWVAWGSGTGSALGDVLRALPPGDRAAWLAVRITGSVLVIPVVEELAFRGFLLPWLVSPDFEKVDPRAWTWSAVLLSSLAFGAIHEHWVLGTLAGVLFAAAKLRRGRLSDAVLAHALANAVVAAGALSGRWGLWG